MAKKPTPKPPKPPVHPQEPVDPKLRQRVDTQAALAEMGVDCALCANEAWWPANGFSDDERIAICGPRDLKCPGFGKDAE